MLTIIIKMDNLQNNNNKIVNKMFNNNKIKSKYLNKINNLTSKLMMNNIEKFKKNKT